MNNLLSPSDSDHGTRIPVLMYHEVTDIAEGRRKTRHMHPCYSLSTQQFENQMEYLSQNDYKTISLQSLFNKDYTNDKSVVITFDDGFIGNYKNALPILNKYNFSATIFAIVQKISTESYLNWEQLKELKDNGISIQSHTMSHRPLGQLNDEEVYFELSESKKIIEDKLGQSVKYVSLPHGSFKKNLIDIARELGYCGICSSNIEYVRPMDIKFTVGRIPIKNKCKIGDFEKIISENRLRIFNCMLVECAKRGLSRMIGLNNYRIIYRCIFRLKL